MLGDVEFVALNGGGKAFGGGIGKAFEARNAKDGIESKTEAIHAIENDHIKGSGGGALFDVAANVDIVVIVAAIGEAVDQSGIAVEGKDHRLFGGEEGVEIVVNQAVRVFGSGLESHEVDDIDDADAKIGLMLAKKRDGSQDLEGGDIAAAGHHDIG